MFWKHTTKCWLKMKTPTTWAGSSDSWQNLTWAEDGSPNKYSLLRNTSAIIGTKTSYTGSRMKVTSDFLMSSLPTLRWQYSKTSYLPRMFKDTKGCMSFSWIKGWNTATSTGPTKFTQNLWYVFFNHLSPGDTTRTMWFIKSSKKSLKWPS